MNMIEKMGLVGILMITSMIPSPHPYQEIIAGLVFVISMAMFVFGNLIMELIKEK